MLEHAGVVWREQAMTIPPAVTYGLTERGAELRGVLDTLGSIARRWEAEGAFARDRKRDRMTPPFLFAG